jgi:hypothetical protein
MDATQDTVVIVRATQIGAHPHPATLAISRPTHKYPRTQCALFMHERARAAPATQFCPALGLPSIHARHKEAGQHAKPIGVSDS